MAPPGENTVAEPKPESRAVKIDERLASKAKIIAETKGIPLSQYLSDLLRPLISRDWLKAIKQLNESDDEPD